jgi:hypothetical protein
MNSFKRVLSSAVLALGLTGLSTAAQVDHLDYTFSALDVNSGNTSLAFKISDTSAPINLPPGAFASIGQPREYCTLDGEFAMWLSSCAGVAVNTNGLVTVLGTNGNTAFFHFGYTDYIDPASFHTSDITLATSTSNSFGTPISPLIPTIATLTISNHVDDPITAAPEPSSCFAVGGGLLAVAFFLRKKRLALQQ